jgi:hypothetical protein
LFARRPISENRLVGMAVDLETKSKGADNMHLVTGTSNKAGSEAVVLAVGRRRMRITAQGQIDAVDLRCDEDEKWTTEFGDGVSRASIIGIEEGSSARLITDLFPNVLAARS